MVSMGERWFLWRQMDSMTDWGRAFASAECTLLVRKTARKPRGRKRGDRACVRNQEKPCAFWKLFAAFRSPGLGIRRFGIHKFKIAGKNEYRKWPSQAVVRAAFRTRDFGFVRVGRRTGKIGV